MSIIKLATPILSNNDLDKFKNYISKYKLNDARLLIDKYMINLDKDNPKFIILNEIYDEIVNEIEVELDNI